MIIIIIFFFEFSLLLRLLLLLPYIHLLVKRTAWEKPWPGIPVYNARGNAVTRFCRRENYGFFVPQQVPCVYSHDSPWWWSGLHRERYYISVISAHGHITIIILVHSFYLHARLFHIRITYIPRVVGILRHNFDHITVKIL